MIREIIKGCQKRRRQSQKELYKMFYAYGMSITLRYADSRDEAAVILNDAFMKVFTKIDQYDSDRPFKPWLRQIIINTAINHYHRHLSQLRPERLEAVHNKMNTRENITSSISYEEIIGMVQQLSPVYRTIFNLHVIEGFKHKEIAEMLEISIGTSKSNLYKAKQNLRVILQKNFI